MPLKPAQGNMYDWVQFVHSHLGGQCPHRCGYCYVQRSRFGINVRYQGPPKIVKPELKCSYGAGKIIFVEHMSDLFAFQIPNEYKMDILTHCRKYPKNEYVIQSKNPLEAFKFISVFPIKFLFGTTIETNVSSLTTKVSYAPAPFYRYAGLKKFKQGGHRIFVSIEPIMSFDVNILAKWMIDLRPEFVSIGADSKDYVLPEPSKEMIEDFIGLLNEANIKVKQKSNLERLLR